MEWNWCVRRGSRKRGTMCIIKRIAERRVERTSDATISVYLVSHVAVVALPEALDDSEEDTALVLAGVGAHDERLAAAEQLAASDLALGALQSEGDLLGVLGLLSEDGLGLTTETLLFHVVSSLSLGKLGSFTGLVLRNFVDCVFLQLWAISSNRLWDMHHLANDFLLNNNKNTIVIK